jgi:minor extracellular protease Epr
VAVKVLDKNGIGYVSDFLRGMQWLYERNDIRLVNMSWGLWAYSSPLERATKRLYDKGMLMVAAAGNRCSTDLPSEEGGGSDGEEGGGSDGEGCDASDVTTYPARHPWVMSVGATDFSDAVAEYSRSGKIDVVAPGGSEETDILICSTGILSTDRGGGYGCSIGTSAAAAHVAGTLALVLGERSTLSFAEAVNLLATTAKKLTKPDGDEYSASEQGEGLIQANEMLEAVK